MYTPRGLPRHCRINQSFRPCLCRGWAFLFHTAHRVRVGEREFTAFPVDIPECRNRLRSVCWKGLSDGCQALKVFSMHELARHEKKNISSFFGILSAVTARLQMCKKIVKMYVLMLTLDIVGQLPRVLKFSTPCPSDTTCGSCKERYE